MKQTSQAKLARESLQLLRAKAHALLNENFPRSRDRYGWLKKHSAKLHMSEMHRSELLALIDTLNHHATHHAR